MKKQRRTQPRSQGEVDEGKFSDWFDAAPIKDVVGLTGM